MEGGEDTSTPGGGTRCSAPREKGLEHSRKGDNFEVFLWHLSWPTWPRGSAGAQKEKCTKFAVRVRCTKSEKCTKFETPNREVYQV